MRIFWSATRRPTERPSSASRTRRCCASGRRRFSWIDQNRDLLRLRAGITAAAMLWRTSDSQEGRLLTGALLKDATRLLKETPEMLAAEERAFVDLSIADDRRKRRRLF